MQGSWRALEKPNQDLRDILLDPPFGYSLGAFWHLEHGSRMIYAALPPCFVFGVGGWIVVFQPSGLFCDLRAAAARVLVDRLLFCNSWAILNHVVVVEFSVQALLGTQQPGSTTCCYCPGNFAEAAAG